MCSVRTITAPEAADLIVDGAVVTVSSSSGMGCPDAVLAAIGERFQRAGHPQTSPPSTLSPLVICMA